MEWFDLIPVWREEFSELTFNGQPVSFIGLLWDRIGFLSCIIMTMIAGILGSIRWKWPFLHIITPIIHYEIWNIPNWFLMWPLDQYASHYYEPEASWLLINFLAIDALCGVLMGAWLLCSLWHLLKLSDTVKIYYSFGFTIASFCC